MNAKTKYIGYGKLHQITKQMIGFIMKFNCPEKQADSLVLNFFFFYQYDHQTVKTNDQ